MGRFGRVIGVLVFGVGVGIIIAYWLKQQEEAFQRQMRQQHPKSPMPTSETQIILSQKTLDQADSGDDLTRINGIGPKTAQALRATGITSFATLASTSPHDLHDKLKGLRGLTPEKINGWIEQAAGLTS